MDTSVALKILITEPESAALKSYLDAHAHLVSSMLLYTELYCAASRRNQIDPALAEAVLSRVDLVDISREDLLRAATSNWGLRSADAIHLACALRVQADTIITYGREMQVAARRAGLIAIAPA